MSADDQKGIGIIWEGVSHPSLEYCYMARIKTGWEFNGMVTAKLGGRGFGLEYVILVDSSFNTQSAKFHLLEGCNIRDMEIGIVNGEWLVDGIIQEDLAGCTDIDIQASPVTNTIPIKRAGLSDGCQTEIYAAWVKLPTLEVEKVSQRYMRINASEYFYSSGTFKARLLLNPSGLVTDYEGIWKEVS